MVFYFLKGEEMNYTLEKDCIRITDKSEFNISHILECGQVFCYEKLEDSFVVFPQNKFAQIYEDEWGYRIVTKDTNFFVNYFDLKRSYSEIKEKLKKYKIMQEPIKFGYGIRILKQDLFETLISFIISANNNIKRIKLILNNLRKNLSKDGRSFPTYEELLSCDEEFFKTMGAGYRAGYLYKVLRQVTPDELKSFESMPTKELRKKLISLSGVGPKVADCVLLFGFNRFDVFPVDTWIEQMYNQFYTNLSNREKISSNLVQEFGMLSGYAQQYLFYFQRSYLGKIN